MLKETIIYTILTTIVLIVAYIFDVLLEMSLFIIFYYFIKSLFSKQFHADTITKSSTNAVRLCFTITFITELVFIFLLISFNLSFYLNIYLGILLGLFSYFLQDYLEKVLIDKSIFKNKDKLLEACKNANLSSLATTRLILKYIDGLKVKEIADLENVEEITILQSIRRSRRKLNI
jgi:hypothetical protein